jgi:hypothetical protein
MDECDCVGHSGGCGGAVDRLHVSVDFLITQLAGGKG